MSKLRSLNTSFWSDPWIETLTPEDKLLFIYLITNEKTNMLGIYEASVKKISFETGIENETVSKALKGFERVGKVNYINNHVILINFMKHQNFNPNMMKSAIDIYNNLPEPLKINNLDIDKKEYQKGFERLSKAMGTVRKVEVEVEREYEYEYEVEDETESSKPEKKISGDNDLKNETSLESKKEKLPKVAQKGFSEEVYNCFEECLRFFPEELWPEKSQSKSWLDTIDKLNRIDNIPFEVVIYIVEKVREDQFWSTNFLSINKLRQKNKDGLKYIQVFYQKFKPKEELINRQTRKEIDSNYEKVLNA